MVKSETRRDAEILVRNLSPRLFGETFRDSKKVKPNHEKTRLRDLSKTLPRFRDPAKIFRDPRFSRYHSAPLSVCLRQGVRIIGGPLNRGFTVKYYSHCYYKLWQYYAKYAYHADKLSHSHSCLLERELPLM